VVLYELKKFEKNLKRKYDYILLLQPTTPIRNLKDINKALSLLKNKNKKYDSIVSIKDVDGNHPLRMKIIKNGYLKNYIDQKKENMLPRQKLPKIYIRSGSFYLIKTSKFLKYNSMVGKKTGFIFLKNIYGLNIDSIDDLILFKNYLK
jgi:CMP-N-acetylneuraminic acid synthetase